MGEQLSRDAESVYFQVINRRIYFSAGSKWSNVESLKRAMLREQFVEDHKEKAIHTLFSSQPLYPYGDISKFFGPQMWNKLGNGEKVYWGWKDPRTSLTFPIWLRVFPQARFLHIVRNGIDVAISMHRRAQKQQRSFLKRVLQIDYSPLTLDFMYCFQLWEEHMSFILENRKIISPENYLELRYEDLLASPAKNLRLIMNFIDYPVEEDVLEKACEQINRGRLDNANNAKPYQDIIPSLASHPLMQQLGYSYSITKGVSEAVYEH
jgi:hypothetical protein